MTDVPSETQPKVLIIDDDPGIQMSLKMALEFYGCSVVTASNGEEGLKALETGSQPCLILVDLMMPVMNGWTFVEKKDQDKRTSAIPVVVLSAFSTKNRPIHARAFIKKPFVLDELMSVVRQYCPAAGSFS